jgi:hypothetical protein
MLIHKCGKGGQYGFVEMNGEYFLDSCCGGCFAVHDVIFCPHCGVKIVREDLIEKK